MDNTEEILKGLEAQEQELQFAEFTSETALKIGLSLVDRARKENKIITIDITRNGHQLFHYAFDGTSPDNDQWVIRKNRVVYRFHKSSLRVGTMLKKLGLTLEEKYFVSPLEYSPFGGAFPIIIKNVGVIGTITVSGLKQEEDHEMVVQAIKEFLNS